jgi:transcriptional regulator with XRE-family HTH domain
VSTLQTVEPSLRSRWLGRWLRALREDRGFMLRHVADMTGVRLAEINAAEHGTHLLEENQVEALLELYGVSDQYERHRLVNLARVARHLRRWEGSADAPPLSRETLDCLWLEAHAVHIRCFSATLVPDLLQLPAYAQVLVRQAGGTAVPPEHASWWEWACTERQQALCGPPLTSLRIVVAEAALHRPPGSSSAVVCDQLHHLVDAPRLPQLTLQVLPTAAPYLPGMDGSFTVFEPVMPHPHAVVVHALTGPLIHEEHAELYAEAFEQLSQAALTPETSADLITEAAKRSSN